MVALEFCKMYAPGYWSCLFDFCLCFVIIIFFSFLVSKVYEGRAEPDAMCTCKPCTGLSIGTTDERGEVLWPQIRDLSSVLGTAAE